MLNETERTHILFLGLRHAGDKWSVLNYPAEEELARISAQVQKRQPKEKAKKLLGCNALSEDDREYKEEICKEDNGKGWFEELYLRGSDDAVVIIYAGE